MGGARQPDDGATDADLLRRFADAGDAGAFARLVARHAAAVRAAARRVVRDEHLAEDATQAAFLALARRPGGVRANPAGWLVRVARRAAARIGRRPPGGVAPPDEPADGRPGPPFEADELALLRAELAALPDPYRRPLLLCYADGLTHAEAAARLGWPVGTVAGRIARAKDLLRVRLARRGLTPLLPLAVAGPAAVPPLRLVLLAILVAAVAYLVAAGRNPDTRTRGQVMLRWLFLVCWDWDLTWKGREHLRPARHELLSLRTALAVTHDWAAGLLVIPPAYYLLLGPAIGGGPAALAGLAAAGVAYLLHLSGCLVSAMLWNERAAALRAATVPG